MALAFASAAVQSSGVARFASRGAISIRRDTGTMDDGRKHLANELERLLTLPLVPGHALEEWYRDARDVLAAMSTRYPDVEVPHEVRHFLIDADIRAKPKDAEYRHDQETVVRQFIADLRSRN